MVGLLAGQALNQRRSAELHEHAKDRALAECEAESVAYVLCEALGIHSGAYSFG